MTPNLRAATFQLETDEYVVFSFAADGLAAPGDEQALTSAEREVVELVRANLSNRQIAERRGTSTRTVANQLASIFRKLEVGSRRELCARGERLLPQPRSERP